MLRPATGRTLKHTWDHLKVIQPSLDAQGRVCHTSKQQGCRPLAETPWSQLYSVSTQFPKVGDRKEIGTLKLAAQLLSDLEEAFAPGQAATIA